MTTTTMTSLLVHCLVYIMEVDTTIDTLARSRINIITPTTRISALRMHICRLSRCLLGRLRTAEGCPYQAWNRLRDRPRLAEYQVLLPPRPRKIRMSRRRTEGLEGRVCHHSRQLEADTRIHTAAVVRLVGEEGLRGEATTIKVEEIVSSRIEVVCRIMLCSYSLRVLGYILEQHLCISNASLRLALLLHHWICSQASSKMVAGSAPNPNAAMPLTWDRLGALLSSPHPILQSLKTLPGSAVIWRYIKSSHQNDPARTFLELLLFLFVVYTWLKSRTRGDKGGRNFVKLSQKVRLEVRATSSRC